MPGPVGFMKHSNFDEVVPIADKAPLVSVIIPTTGRKEVVNAVRSVLDQTWTNLEIIVSIDGDGNLLKGISLPEDQRVKVTESGSHVGAQLARGRGIEESSGTFVAFLDDDDKWLPSKIATQLDLAQRHLSSGQEHVLIGCRASYVYPDGSRVRESPRRLPRPGESIAQYLFERRKITPGETAIGSSMILFDRELARLVPIRFSIPIHQDWDWIMQVDRNTSTKVDFCPEILMEYTEHPPGESLSTSAKWFTSAQYFESQRSVLTSRQFADAVLCYSVPLALKQRQWRAVGKLLHLSLKEGSPGLPALIFVGLMCLKFAMPSEAGRTRVEQLLKRSRSRQGR